MSSCSRPEVNYPCRVPMKIIGKEGRNAHALRTLVNAAATKLRKRAVLEILE